VAVGTALMREETSKTHSGVRFPEVLDSAVISGAFCVSDRGRISDEIVTHQLIGNRNVQSRSSSTASRRSICSRYGFDVIIVFHF
jgi:hypothetical protein